MNNHSHNDTTINNKVPTSSNNISTIVTLLAQLIIKLKSSLSEISQIATEQNQHPINLINSNTEINQTLQSVLAELEKLEVQTDITQKIIDTIKNFYNYPNAEKLLRLHQIIISIDAVITKTGQNKSHQTPIETIKEITKLSVEKLKLAKLNYIEDIILNFPVKYATSEEDAENGKAKSAKIVINGLYKTHTLIRTKTGKKMLVVTFEQPETDETFFGIWMDKSTQFALNIIDKSNINVMLGTETTYNHRRAFFFPEIIKKQKTPSKLIEEHKANAEANNAKKTTKNSDQPITVFPIYQIPKDLTKKMYQRYLELGLSTYIDNIIETLPDYILRKNQLPQIKDAIYTIHNPKTQLNIDAIMERTHPSIKRFAYEELFYQQLGLVIKKQSLTKNTGIKFDVKDEFMQKIKEMMPFELTTPQRRVIREIFNNMKTSNQMNRLLEGDVGSGKTIVSFIAMTMCVLNGYQAAIIAPTEVLAEQHFNNLQKFIKGTTFKACLLVGSTNRKAKLELKGLLAMGLVNFVVGTHAILEDDVIFKSLGLVVIDEQHRFGVVQRKRLIDKGYNPDILLMSATPIPRTLALSMFGDLDVSIIDELPPGRTPIKTFVYPESKLNRVYELMQDELRAGHQAYVVYPLIDESETIESKALLTELEQLRTIFAGHAVSELHGRMNAAEKNDIMRRFKNGEIDILVSTTVIEVGVDVPNSTVMLIENAERFGLSQLHQLRGRIGRGANQSYCFLVHQSGAGQESKERLMALEKYSDGFKLAEIDLEARGAGDFFGTMQSGVAAYKYVDITRDYELLNKARVDVQEILETDPFFDKPEHKAIKDGVLRKWSEMINYLDIG